MKNYTITLHGGREGELRIRADVLRDFLDALIDGARQATRFAVEGTSVRPGTRPAWLDAACTFDVVGLSGGSTVLEQEVPTLAEAAPSEFRPAENTLFDTSDALDDEALSDGVNSRWTALDYLGETLGAAAAGDRNHVRADRSLLDACVRLLAATPTTVQHITFSGLHGKPEPLELRRDAIGVIERLRDETPPPRAVRVAGMLDTISATRPNVIVQLTSGERIVVWLYMHNPTRLHDLWRKRVVISGIANYRPNGKLRQIEAESLDLAREADALFDQLPPPPEILPIVVPQPQDETSGVAAFFGTWVGDETDSEILDALRSLK